MGHEAKIWVSGLVFCLKQGFGPLGWHLGLEAWRWISQLEFRPRGWDLGLEARSWASMLEYGLPGGGDVEGEGGEGEGEISPV